MIQAGTGLSLRTSPADHVLQAESRDFSWSCELQLALQPVLGLLVPAPAVHVVTVPAGLAGWVKLAPVAGACEH